MGKTVASFNVLNHFLTIINKFTTLHVHFKVNKTRFTDKKKNNAGRPGAAVKVCSPLFITG